MTTLITRRHALVVVSMSLLVACAHGGGPVNDQPIKASLYKQPQCPCCGKYADYLRQNGFDVQVFEVSGLSDLKREYNVPTPLEGCHTTLAGDYVIEGHVPVGLVKRLLLEKPAIRGISLPGMPMGSPGMGGEKTAPFTIYEISEDTSKVYATE
jgi:hypothetical protein